MKLWNAEPKIQGEMSEFFPVIANEVTDQFSNSKVFLLRLRYLAFRSQTQNICEIFFDLLQIVGGQTGQTNENSILSLPQRKYICSSCCA